MMDLGRCMSVGSEASDKECEENGEQSFHDDGDYITAGRRTSGEPKRRLCRALPRSTVTPRGALIGDASATACQER
jgi:hypothetical protein